MISIPGGSFPFGPDKKKVDVKDFMIDRTEVTNAAYKAVVKDFEFADGRGNHPVVEISYEEAENYCVAVGKRLPTGPEWERAARGDDGRAYPWGNEFVGANANTSESGTADTVAVGSFPKGKSPYGVLDLCGNASEWVDEMGKETAYRHRRGGSFFDVATNAATYSISNALYDDAHPYNGFRCAK
ncbi:MAG: SUMF1/EgtB/PvdO family nonheme iron enzyme [Nitrospinae bacterium]|nr:SUMF1/EgtB/PvdO family nonheme iron enzyme [Nitrospinota bacterium]